MKCSIAWLPLFVALSGGALVACSSHDGPGGSGGPGSSGPGSKPEPREMPLATPSIGGYTLVDLFPPGQVSYPSGIVWQKTAGAPPFVLLREGRVLEMVAGTPREVLDISQAVAMVSEGGALGIVLHPAFGDGSGPSPYVFLWYNAKGDPKNRQRLVRYTWRVSDRTFDAASELVLLDQDEDTPEHNGGRIAFGPDGFLYFGNGDDTLPVNHQRLDRALFAGIFRIDVDNRGGAVSHAPPRKPEGGVTAGYSIPNDNPFVGVPGALEEFYALGLRNPFGFSFDRTTGELWAGDVGDTWREEVDLIVKGGNYEWPQKEGEVARQGAALAIGKAQPPKYAYSHAEMADLAAVLGGYVYRGKALPALTGKYVYSDYVSSRIWALDVASGAAKRSTLVDNIWKRVPLGVAEDNDGEIYLVHSEGISRLSADASKDSVPKRLSETTLFKDVAALEPEPSLVPYDINSPLWSDGAAKRRWIRVPAGQRVDLADDGTLKFPVGTTFVKHFELPVSVKPHVRTRRLETRALVVGQETVYGVAYRWNAEGTDADLVVDPTEEAIDDEAGGPKWTWHFPSFGECWSCHRAKNRVLGFTAQQLNLEVEGKKQLADLAGKGVFDAAATAKMPPSLARPSDTAASLDERASAYLAANCSPCHNPAGSFLGGGETWNALPGVAAADRRLIGASHNNEPMASALGLGSAPLVDPGNPEGSLLLARMKHNELDLRMPPLLRNVVDADGALLIEQWIRSLK